MAEAFSNPTRSQARSWLILLLSAAMEAVWATALGLSQGFTQVGPTVVFVIGLVLSMFGLGYATKRIPITVAYAVWVGVGAALTVLAAIALGTESASPAKLAFITGIVACASGLKLTAHSEASNSEPCA